MARMNYDLEFRNLVWQTWRKCGRNAAEAERELQKLGYTVTRAQIGLWIKQDGGDDGLTWHQRADRADAEERRAKDAVQSARQRTLAGLLEQKERYENYLRQLPSSEFDHRAAGVLLSIGGKIKDLEESLLKTGEVMYAAPEVIKEFLKYLQRQNIRDARIKDAVMQYIDGFLQEISP